MMVWNHFPRLAYGCFVVESSVPASIQAKNNLSAIQTSEIYSLFLSATLQVETATTTLVVGDDSEERLGAHCRHKPRELICYYTFLAG